MHELCARCTVKRHVVSGGAEGVMTQRARVEAVLGRTTV
jgi:hypothetical protein